MCISLQADVVRLLLEHGANVDIRSRDLFRESALHAATVRGNSEVVQVLLEYEASIDVINATHETPLYVAGGADGQSLAMMQLLLQNGASPNGCVGKDHQHNGETRPLVSVLRSSGRDKLDRARALISKGADIASSSPMGYTPLHVAAETKSKQMTELLLKRGANPNALDSRGRTPLHYLSSPLPMEAVTFERVAGVVNVLLENGARVDATSDDGVTALINAVIEDSHHVMRRLFEDGQDNLPDYD